MYYFTITEISVCRIVVKQKQNVSPTSTVLIHAVQTCPYANVKIVSLNNKNCSVYLEIRNRYLQPTYKKMSVIDC